MKNLRWISLILLAIFIISCTPATSTATPVTPEQTESPIPETQKIEPIPWDSFQKGWTYYYPNVSITQTVYDPEGYLWVSSTLGISKIDLVTDEITDFGKPDGLDTFYNLTIFDGKPWVTGTDGEVAYLSNDKWVIEKVSDGHARLIIDSDNTLWYLGEKVYYLDTDQWKMFDIPEEYYQNYNNFYFVAKSKDGSLWFNSYAGVLQYDGANWAMHWDLLSTSDIGTLSDGTILFISSNQISAYDGQNIVPIVFPNRRYIFVDFYFLTPEKDLFLKLYPLKNEEFSSTYIIKNGKVIEAEDVNFDNKPLEDIYKPNLLTPLGWVFYSKSEVYLYDGEDWKTYSINKDSSLSKLEYPGVIGFSPDGSLWLSEGGHPVNFDDKQLSYPFDESPCVNYYNYNYDSKLTLDSEGIWYSSGYESNSLCYVDLDNSSAVENKIPFSFVSSDVAPDGSLWIASSAGFIAQITPEILSKNDYTLIKLIKIGGEDFSTILSPTRIKVDSQGAVWVYVKDDGIYRYQDGIWAGYGQADIIDDTSFAIDSQGNLWVGKSGKLMKYENNQWIEYSIACVNPTKLTITPDDTVWFVNGCDGVYKFKDGNFTHFTSEEVGGFVPEKILIAPDGAAWFFSYQKWSRYQE